MSIFDDTRADWNARPPLRPRTLVPWSARIGVSWHWIGPGKGPSASGPHSACLVQVRDWQHQHQTRPGDPWKDIGYNALICQHGRAIEGRGLEFSGSHSPGVNVAHVGVQFMVGDKSGGITPAMVARAQRLRADVGALGKNIRRDWGHRDDPKAGTECPGDAIEKWVHSGGPTKPAPAPPTTTPTPTPAPTKEPIMHTLVRLKGTDAVWLSDLITRRWVTAGADIDGVRATLKARGLPATVTDVPSLAPYGVPVGPEVKA